VPSVWRPPAICERSDAIKTFLTKGQNLSNGFLSMAFRSAQDSAAAENIDYGRQILETTAVVYMYVEGFCRPIASWCEGFLLVVSLNSPQHVFIALLRALSIKQYPAVSPMAPTFA